jgi:AcrR family transcriptional regulator
VNEPNEPSPSLADQQQQLTRSRILRAAREALAQKGFDATVEEIAEASGVSPRTIFRHYPSRDQLIAAAAKEMFEVLVRPIEGLPNPATDLDGWLEALSLQIHTRLANVLGRAFWDIRVPNPNEPDTSAQSRAGLRFRVRGVTGIATEAWQAAGGMGEPPEPLIKVFGLFCSAFTTQALASDFGHTPEQTAALTAHTLKVLLVKAVEEQRRAT